MLASNLVPAETGAYNHLPGGKLTTGLRGTTTATSNLAPVEMSRHQGQHQPDQNGSSASFNVLTRMTSLDPDVISNLLDNQTRTP